MKRLVTLVSIFCAGALPLILWGSAEDVFFFPWRTALLVAVGAALVAGGWRWLTGRESPSIAAREIPWAGFALWSVAAVAWSENPPESLRRGIEIAGSVAALWLGVVAVRSGNSGKILFAALAAATACSIYGLAQVVGLDPMPWAMMFGGRAFGTLGNPDYYAGHMLVVAPLAVALLMRGGALSYWRMALVALFIAGLILSQVRGAWMAAAALAAIAAWQARGFLADAKQRRKILVMAGCTGALAMVALIASPGIRDRFASIFSMGGYDGAGRRYLWRVASTIWSERPLAGFGTGSYKYEFPRWQHLGEKVGIAEFRGYAYSEHAHNEILQIGAETGAVGAGLFCWGLLAWGLAWRRRLKELRAAGPSGADSAWAQLGMGWGILGGFIYSFVNFPLQIVPTSVLWWMLVGMSLAEASANAPRIGFPRIAGAMLGFMAILGGLLGPALAGADLVGDVYLRELRGRLGLGDWSTASGAGGQAEKLLGHDWRVYRYMSRLGLATDNQELVERGVLARLRLHPDMAEPLSDRVEAARKRGDMVAAERLARELLAKAPNYPSGWGVLGEMAFERRDYKAAAEAFAKAAYYQDRNAQWHHNLASSLGSMKKYAEAIEADRRAVERDPRFVEAYIGIALSARALGDRETERWAAEKAYSIAPDDPRTLTLMSRLR